MSGNFRGIMASPWTHLLIAVLITPLSGLAIFWASFFVIAELDEGWHPVWFGDSSNAQVIVLRPDQSSGGFAPELIPVSFIADYRSTHPGCTFVIPAGREGRVRERLETETKLHWDTLEVKPLSDGQEEITLYYMDRTDDSHGSRYRASGTGVQLEKYRYVADRGGIGILLFAMVLTFLTHVLVLGFFLVRAIYLWRKKRGSQDVVMAGT